MKINYFDFIKQFPESVNFNDFDGLPCLNIIDSMRQMHDVLDSNKPILEINFTKLSDIVLKAKTTNDEKLNILTKNISIGLEDEIFFYISQTDGMIICEINNKMEKNGGFHIKQNKYNKYRYFEKIEKDSIKRKVLIDIALYGKDS